MNEYASQETQQQLLAWRTELPTPIATLDGPQLRLNVHLQLHYCTVWVFISRSALVSQVRNYLTNKDGGENDLESPEAYELSKSCIHHAERIIDLIDLLQAHSLLGRFSHTDFHACSCAIIVILLESILHPQLTFYFKVRTAMDALSLMAPTSDFARDTLKYVHHFQEVVNNALAIISRQERQRLNKRENDPTEAPDCQACCATETTVDPTGVPEELSRSHYHTASGIEEVSSIPSGNLPNDRPGDGERDKPLLDEIRSLLEAGPFTDSGLLGFDGYYAPDAIDSSTSCIWN